MNYMRICEAGYFTATLCEDVEIVDGEARRRAKAFTLLRCHGVLFNGR